MSINIKPDEMKLHRSISSMFHLSDDGSTHYLLAFGVLDLGTSFSPPSVRGYVFCQNEPDYITCPFILNRTTDADFIVGAIKVFNDQAYFHGVHAGLVKDFKGGAENVPCTLWTSIWCSSDTVLAVNELKDTETAKLLTNFNTILAGTPLFKEAMLKDSKALEKWCEKKYSVNVANAITYRAKRACKLSKSRAETSGDKNENADSAKEPKEAAAAFRSSMLSWAKYYDPPFLDRFIVVNDSDRETTKNVLEKAKIDTFVKEQLLDAYCDYCQMLDGVANEISCATTPFKELLVKLATPTQPPAPEGRPRRLPMTKRDVFDAAAAPAAAADDDDSDNDDVDDGAGDAADKTVAADAKADAAEGPGKRKGRPAKHVRCKVKPVPLYHPPSIATLATRLSSPDPLPS